MIDHTGLNVSDYPKSKRSISPPLHRWVTRW